MSTPVATKKGIDIPMGIVGLVLTLGFCVWIALSPGRLYPVMLGGTLGLVGTVICVLGLIKGSGRAAAVVGIVAYLLGWVINTLVIGRL